MAKLIIIKVNLSLLDKEQLFKGSKGTYLDLVVQLKDEADKYGNHGMVTQGIAKEARAAGVRGAILGNAKIMGEGPAKDTPNKLSNDISDDLPF